MKRGISYEDFLHYDHQYIERNITRRQKGYDEKMEELLLHQGNRRLHSVFDADDDKPY